MDRRFAWLFHLVTTYLLICASDKPCARLQFTGLRDGVFSVTENTTGVFEFQVVDNSCSDPGGILLKVLKQTKGEDVPHCMFFLGATKVPCRNLSRVGKHKYKVQRVFHRSDNITWKWRSVPEGAVESKEVTFNILYPARVTSLQVLADNHRHHNTVQQNSSVTTVCDWEQGNPPVTPRLLQKDEKELKPVKHSESQISFTFPAIGCDDLGRISCEAPNAIENQTVPLLVECPPEILMIENDNGFVRGQGVSSQLAFGFRAHSRDITNCQLQQTSTDDSDNATTPRSISCLSAVTVTGTPPDLQLSVRLENVTKQDEGQWTLTLTNEVGHGFLHFRLTVADFRDIEGGLGHQSTKDDGTLYRFVTGSTNIDNSEDDVLGQRMTLVIVGANVAGFAVLAAIIITLNVVFLRRGRRVNGSPTEMQGLSLGDLRALHRPPTMYSEGSNFYEEIADGVLPLNLGAQVPDPVCRRIEPETGSDGSLVQATMRSPNTHSEPSTDAIVMSTEGGPSSSGGYIDMGQSVKPAVNHKWASQESLGESSDYVDMNERCKSDDRRRRAASRLYENIPQ